MKAPSPGIYPGVPEAEYFAWPIANCSIIKGHRKSPAHVRHEMMKPKETVALNLGHAIHAAILEPDTFNDRFVVGPEGRAGTLKYKAAVEEIAEKHPNASLLRPHEFAICMETKDRAWAHPRVAEILGGTQGSNELSCVAEVMGGPFKFRIDRYCDYEGVPTIVDIKTTRDASPWSFGSDAAKYDYPLSAAGYLKGLNALDPNRRRFLTVAVEKEGPGVAIYEYRLDALNAGEVRFEKFLSLHRACERSDIWPGYSAEIQEPMIPAYYLNSQEYED